MTSQLDVRFGVQVPQLALRPADVVTHDAATEAIELADAYGLCDGFPLDGSQRFTLGVGLGERVDGSWAASTVADFEPRQNGKNDTVAARELAGLLLFGERLIIHTAHAMLSFLRLVAVFENWDELRSKVARVRYANGEQGIELLTGQRLKYLARSGGSGRGFAKADLVVYDEAQHLQAEHLAASGPTRLANPNSQSWYLGSGGLSTSHVAWRMRRRALAGEAGRFGYVEHTAELVSMVDGRLDSSLPAVDDREAWARANSAYGSRITDEALAGLLEELGPELFGRECLCLWDRELGDEGREIPVSVWDAACSPSAAPGEGVVVGVDVNPERSWTSICVADGSVVEFVKRSSGTAGLVTRCAELAAKWGAPVALDTAGPVGSFRGELERAGCRVVEVAGRELAKACGTFHDDLFEGRVSVRRHPDLDAAVAGVRKRSAGDAWVWDRRDSTVDVSPLVAATVAHWAASQVAPSPIFAY
jgi:hypothetical protein